MVTPRPGSLSSVAGRLRPGGPTAFGEGREARDVSESVPDPVREFADGVLTVEEGGTYDQRFAEEWIDVPSRFDRESAVATWGFDGRVAVTVHRAGD